MADWIKGDKRKQEHEPNTEMTVIGKGTVRKQTQVT